MEFKTLVVAIAFIAAAIAEPAAAGEFKFRYKNHEVETAGGRTDMMARLDRSIERYCEAGGVRSLSARRAAKECRESLKADMMAKVDNVAFASLDRR